VRKENLLYAAPSWFISSHLEIKFCLNLAAADAKVCRLFWRECRTFLEPLEKKKDVDCLERYEKKKRLRGIDRQIGDHQFVSPRIT
jgi:hypothetical protein